MKTFLLLLMCLPTIVVSQTPSQMLGSSILFATSGAFGAIRELDQSHPVQLQKAFPRYSLSRDTYGNKYKDGDHTKGEKFWGSTRWFAPLTDDYHEMGFYHNALLLTGITGYGYSSYTGALLNNDVEIRYVWKFKNEKQWYQYIDKDLTEKPWWAWGGELVLNWTAYNTGRALMFNYVQSK